MAGAYPDNVARRMAWDADGSMVLIASGADGPLGQSVSPIATSYVVASTANKEALNDEDLATAVQANIARASVHHCILFPEQREIDGIYWSTHGIATSQWTDHSVNSTNGSDGTWVDMSVGGAGADPSDGYRDNIISQVLSNIVAVRAFIGRSQVSSGTNRYKTLHYYGSITPSGTPDRLLFLDPDNADAEFTKPLDFGDVPRGQTQTDTFKVKNNSSTVTANTVQVTAEDLTGGAGSWYEFSEDDVAYQGTINLGNISAAGTKLVFVRQVVPDAQTPGLYVARVKANQASWS